jgi:hypothetical protein
MKMIKRDVMLSSVETCGQRPLHPAKQAERPSHSPFDKLRVTPLLKNNFVSFLDNCLV